MNLGVRRRFPTHRVGANIDRNLMARLGARKSASGPTRENIPRHIQSPSTHASPVMSRNTLDRTQRIFSINLQHLRSRHQALPTQLPLPQTSLHQILTQDHLHRTVPRQHHHHLSTDQTTPCNRHIVSFLASFTAPTMFQLMAGLLTTFIK